ncbi:MAG: CTP synthase, partial [Chloroflexota bacterium]|nr:CTP synthase [Chloroflexota bacterium]
FVLHNAYRDDKDDSGLVAIGISPVGRVVEIVEQVEHPFMVGVQFHPEFLSRPQAPHPLFREFVRAAKETLREGAQHAMPIAPKEAG